MSFSTEVKNEISGIKGEDRHCRIAEMAAIINSCGVVSAQNDKINLLIRSDSKQVMEKAIYIISNDFGYNLEAEIVKDKKGNKKSNMYCINVDKHETAQKLLWSVGILNMKTNSVNFKIDTMVTKSVCCKRAYIRSAFLINGSISDPRKAYHLEFVFGNEKYSQEFSCLINSFGLNSKVILRKDSFLVYLKEGEKIVDILNIMGAHNSLLQLENLRITKEVMNNINRKVNCQSANLNKAITASVKQVEDIEFISRVKGLTYLPPHLEELARLRLKQPEMTLKELGESLSEPISKSGVNHRLKKISKIADDIKSNI